MGCHEAFFRTDVSINRRVGSPSDGEFFLQDLDELNSALSIELDDLFGASSVGAIRPDSEVRLPVFMVNGPSGLPNILKPEGDVLVFPALNAHAFLPWKPLRSH